jgi:hypothetical protein
MRYIWMHRSRHVGRNFDIEEENKRENKLAAEGRG